MLQLRGRQMKNIYRVLLLLVLIGFMFPVQIRAEEPNVTEDIIAGAEVVMRENFEILAYKEMMRISTLLITDPVQYMIEYNRINEAYKNYLDSTDTIYDIYSEEDIKYLQQCVETETHGCQVFIDKVNVANVIINRAKDETDKFPNTIKEVVISPGQFSYNKKNIDPLTIAACEYAYLCGDTTEGALYFKSSRKTSTFNGATYLFTDSTGHHYYR